MKVPEGFRYLLDSRHGILCRSATIDYVMRAVISYKYTGVSIDDLERTLRVVYDSLISVGVDPFCIQFAKRDGEIEQKTPAEMMQDAFREIEASDMLFVIQSSRDRSEGMLMEVGYALARNMPVIIATHTSVRNTYLPDMTDQRIKYSSLYDLNKKILSHWSRAQVLTR